MPYGEFKAPKGVIKVELKLKDNKISKISISGDFFMYPEDALKKLESSLIGIEVEREALLAAVKGFYILTSARTPMVEPQHWVEAVMRAVEGNR